MTSSFSIKLDKPVLPQRVAYGHFDGKHPSLAFATSSDTVLVHSPHGLQEGQKDIQQLAINKQISGLHAAPITSTGPSSGNSESAQDCLLVGCPTAVLAYNVERNSELFYEEVEDGVTALSAGYVDGVDAPLVVVGGNCTVYGFDGDGKEQFWNSASDKVTALTFRGVSDGKGGSVARQLLVGSEDGEVHVYRHLDEVFQVTEDETVTHLCALSKEPGSGADLKALHRAEFIYTLDNGTVGIYNNKSRVWFAQGKHRCNGVVGYDITGDGSPEVVIGWSNGRVEARRLTDGSRVFKDKLPGAVAALTLGDYRMDGREQVLAVSTGGELRGYLSKTAGASVETKQRAKEQGQAPEDESVVSELFEQKQQLLAQLQTYEQTLASLKSGEVGGGVLPHDACVHYGVSHDSAAQAITLHFLPSHDAAIKLITLSGDGFIPEGTRVLTPADTLPAKGKKRGARRSKGEVCVPIRPSKYVQGAVTAQVVVGYGSSAQDHVFTAQFAFPKFAAFYNVAPAALFAACGPEWPASPEGVTLNDVLPDLGQGNVADYIKEDVYPVLKILSDKPDGPQISDLELQRRRLACSYVTFNVADRANRVLLWVHRAFNLVSEPESKSGGANGTARSGAVLRHLPSSVANENEFVACFRNVVDGTPLLIHASQGSPGFTKVQVHTPNMSLAGEVVQDLCAYLRIRDVGSIARFPEEMAQFDLTRQQVEQCNANRLKLSADIADTGNAVKNLVIRAEDARLLGDGTYCMQFFRNLLTLNGEMVSEYRKRANNHRQLLAGLKEVNRMIEKAARLRVGKFRAQVKSASRQCVKRNNVQTLQNIITLGSAN